MSLPDVLLVDDDSEALLSLSRALRAAGLQAALHASTTTGKALNLLRDCSPKVAVLDLCLNEYDGVESGLALLREVRRRNPTCRIIVLTGNGSLEAGIRSLNEGAANFVEKPADVLHLAALIRDGIQQSELRRNYDEIKRESMEKSCCALIIGKSRQAELLRESTAYAARTNQAVLITGETGTGKGLCARVIHGLGERAQHRFVRYQPNYGSADLVSSDLYGHMRGAFTGADADRTGLIAEAHQGTLFLDEIDALPLETQVALLGVLQDRILRVVGSSSEQRVEFRLICASNQDVPECVRSGKIRPDFYHRIAHFTIHVPALRDRMEDIPVLCDHLLGQMRERERITVLGIETAALHILSQYIWPGNVRELQAVVEGAASRAQFAGKVYIDEDDVCLPSDHVRSGSTNFHEQVNVFKRQLIEHALLRSQHNQARAAKEIGLDRSTMRRILARQAV